LQRINHHFDARPADRRWSAFSADYRRGYESNDLVDQSEIEQTTKQCAAAFHHYVRNVSFLRKEFNEPFEINVPFPHRELLDICTVSNVPILQ